MKLRKRAFGLAALLAWEGYWAFEYLTAPIPDYEMQSVAAVLLGGIIPGIVIGLLVALRLAFAAVLKFRN